MNDHILFEDCINSFRPEKNQHPGSRDGSTCSYVLTNFNLSEQWELPNCKIQPSFIVQLPGPYVAFISRIENPEWSNFNDPHLFGVAMSAIISFVAGRPCRSTRDDFLCRGEALSEEDAIRLSIFNPILTAGPGSEPTQLSSERLGELKSAVTRLVTLLATVKYTDYIAAMQAIRLVQLSLLNKRDDFGLAYLLIVSAIESIALRAVQRDKEKAKHPKDATFTARAAHDDDFAELLQAYREARGQNKFLKERYVKFISNFAPVAEWSSFVPHRLQETVDYYSEYLPDNNTRRMVEKHWSESYPEDLSSEQILTILADSYRHRSLFVHSGKQPPHREPEPYKRFFQTLYNQEVYPAAEILLPNYELLVGIARCSITKWLSTR